MSSSNNNKTSVFLDGHIDRSNWKRVKLGDVLSLADGDWIESKDQSNSGYRLIQTGNIGEGIFETHIERARFISPETFCRLKCTEVFAGDCLISRLPDPIGRACILPDVNTRMITAVDCAIARPVDGKIDMRFFVYYTSTSDYKGQMERSLMGSTRQRISRKSLNDVTISLPDVNVQKEIVSSLSAIDTQISNLQSLVLKYEAIKKATVKLLLMPKVDWHSIKLKDFESHKNNTCSRSLTTSSSGRIRNIHYGDILVKFNEIVSLKEHRIDCLTNEGELRSPADYIQDGDIIIADTAEDEAAGKVVEMHDVEDIKAVAGLHTVFLRPPEMVFACGWLGYWMNSNYYHDQLLPYMTGIKVLSLSKSSLLETKIFYPPRLEQERIVNVLESISSHIATLKTQVAKLQDLKQGMMSYFFG